MANWQNTLVPKASVYLHDFVGTGWNGVPHLHGGLRNAGNTCFLNASLQALYHVPNFVNVLTKDDVHRSSCHKPLSCCTCAVFTAYKNLTTNTVSIPTTLIMLLPKIKKGLTRGKQHDAEEFVTGLLDTMESELLANFPNIDYCSSQTNAVAQVFKSWISTSVKCVNKECGKVSSTTYSVQRMVWMQPEVESVQQGLDEFLQGEIVDDCFCKTCKEKKMMKYDFFKPPNVLVVAIKRFDYESGKARIVQGSVCIEETLQVPNSLDGNKYVYQFRSAVIHEGPGLGSGHYFTVASCPDGSLHLFNDSTVSQIQSLNESRYQNGVYLLFYDLQPGPREVKPKSAGMNPINSRTTPKKMSVSTKKRPMVFTPNRSPFRKKFTPAMIISPKRSRKSMKRLAFDSTKPRAIDEGDTDLAVPLKAVPPVTIKWTGRTEQKSTSSQSSHVYEVAHTDKKEIFSPTDMEPLKRVPPVFIKWADRTNPKSSSSQSSHMYEIVNTQGREVHSPTEAEPLKRVPPVFIKWADRTHPKSSSSQSSHVYEIANTQGREVRSPTEAEIDDDLFPSEIEMDELFPSEIENDEEAFHLENEANYCLTTHDNDEVSSEVENNPFQLTQNDVEGAYLPKPDVGCNNVKDLKRWLQCRGLPSGGVKEDLVLLVQKYMEMGREHIIDPGVDKGRCYEQKKALLQASQGLPVASNAQHFPVDGWDTFPSNDLPTNFNFGSVFHYLVETMPQYDGEEGDETSDEDEIVDAEVVKVKDPFESTERDEMLRCKKLRRGLTYYKSKYIRGCQDSISGRIHYFKGHVRASMNMCAYWVHVALSQISGRVMYCCCDKSCSQRALGRCSHVGAMLLFLLGHIRLNGCKALTCTSKPCEWNKGSLKRDPGVADARQYESFKIDVKRRSTFNPRPTRYQFQFPNQQDINNFLAAMSYKKCYWTLLMEIVYPDADYSDSDLQDHFPHLRNIFYSNLKDFIDDLKPKTEEGTPCKYKGPLEVEGTKEQAKSALWVLLRSIHNSAGKCHSISRFQTPSAIMNHLRRSIWQIDCGVTKAMNYGTQKEKTAREAYESEMQLHDPTVKVKVTGMFVHTEYLGLSCSPDGIVTASAQPDKLLEIKCPHTLRNVHPRDFEKHLTPKQLRSFWLENVSGKTTLKTETEYYDQVQMNMALLELSHCDLVVWSAKGIIIVPVSFDPLRWRLISQKLTKFHWEYVTIEYFLQRTPRNLHPLQLK